MLDNILKYIQTCKRKPNSMLVQYSNLTDADPNEFFVTILYLLA